MTDRRKRAAMTREMTGYQNKMMGDYETRGFTTAHLRRPPTEPGPEPTSKPSEPAPSQPTSTTKPESSSS